MDKQRLKDELVTLVAGDLEALEQAQRDTVHGATHAEAKAENDKDTRALEQTYLARGQAQRVEELRAALAEVKALAVRAFRDNDPVAMGALVVADEDGAEQTFFIAPQRGGTRLANGAVQVVTLNSPLGRALLGARAGDDCELDAPKRRTLSIVRVS